MSWGIVAVMPYFGLVLLLTHVGVGALWLGAMAYSLVVVQPRLARLSGSAVAAEDAYRELAAGNRWRVVGLLVALGGSGFGLVAVGAAGTGRPATWWVLPAVQRRFRHVAVTLAAVVAAAFVLGVVAGWLPR